MNDHNELYTLWCKNAVADAALIRELKEMDAADIESAFCRELQFGTGGLRGVLGAGTDRMNVYTVARASKGLAGYVVSHFSPEQRSIAVSYDSRLNSRLFASVSANVFARAGIRVHICRELMPTPFLSYCVRELDCAAGVMVTASHNPAKYNGYKVYGPDGCQITDRAADEIFAEIRSADYFGAEIVSSLDDPLISFVGDELYDRFIATVRALSVVGSAEADRDIPIVYSPLHGTGLRPVTRILKESGFTNVRVVTEQSAPDGHFPTCPYPNPELPEAMALGLAAAKDCGAELFIATDPDCDRIGVAVREGEGYRLLTGNEVGILLLDHICALRRERGTMPEEPVIIKTIVTTDTAEQIAEKYGVRTVNVLTGFKYIGEQIALLERAGKKDSYLFGFEESCGYLSGTHARDKDAVNAALLVCEMAAYDRARGVRLIDRLNALYREFGFRLNTLRSYSFEGVEGFGRMKSIMAELRKGLSEVGGRSVIKTLDYSRGLDGLPVSDVLKFMLDCGSVTVRPSGTEPKLKIYLSVVAQSRDEAETIAAALFTQLETKLK